MLYDTIPGEDVMSVYLLTRDRESMADLSINTKKSNLVNQLRLAVVNYRDRNEGFQTGAETAQRQLLHQSPWQNV